MVYDLLGAFCCCGSFCCLTQCAVSAVVTTVLWPCQQLLQHLHWLPAFLRIKYKITTLPYKVVTLNQPLNLTHIAPCTPGRSLRSQDQHLLLEPAVSTVIGSRGFSYAAPSIWNKLPLEIDNSSSFASFKRNLNKFLVPSLRPAPRHLSPSDCPRLRFDPPADHARATNDRIVLYCNEVHAGHGRCSGTEGKSVEQGPNLAKYLTIHRKIIVSLS